MSVDDYKRQQDLLFQQIDEKAKLARQAREAKIADAMKAKRNQKEIAAIARGLSVSAEELQKTIEKQMRELDPDGL